MTRKQPLMPVWILTWVLCALSLAGCSQLRFPKIDPTGRRIFEPSPSRSEFINPLGDGQLPGFPRPAFSRPDKLQPCPQPGTPSPVTPTPSPLPAVTTPPAVEANQSGRIVITPATSVASIGTEVLLLAGIRDTQGNYLSGQMLAWSLPAGNQGRFTATRQTGRELLDWLARQGTGKPTANHVTSVTASSAEVLDRGTANTQDDLLLASGQTWVRLTSATEGISQISVSAPRAAQWNRQLQTARVYWVDAQWQLPPSISAPRGKPQTLTTTVTQRSTGLPLAGWIVRYEVVGKTDAASLGDRAGQAMQVTTNEQGQASIQITPSEQQSGFTQVQIQIARPATADGKVPQLNAYQGWSTIAWSTPTLQIQSTGPSRATIGAVLQYKITIVNAGDLPANNVVLTDKLPPQLKLTGSSLAGQTFGDSTQWLIGDIPPRTSRTLDVRCQAKNAGDIVYRWNARSDDGLHVESSTATSITAAKLDVSMTGPQTARVGEQVEFQITIRNTSKVNLTNIALSDRFDVGLQHVDRFQTRSAPGIREIRLSIPQLAAGQMIKQPLTFHIAKAGELCQLIDVATSDGQHVQARKCLTAVAEPKAEPSETTPRQPVIPDPEESNKNPDDPDSSANPVRGQLELKISDFSDPVKVGSTVKYVITLKNDRTTTDQRIGLKLHLPVNFQLQKITQDQSTDQPKFSPDGRTISLPEIKEMLAGETLSYEVEVKAIQFGPATIRVEATSTRTQEPVVASEKTTINPQ
jgi:uncharacterized repeat protein (TIGR01451 family)